MSGRPGRFDEPWLGHGLRHDPFNFIVGPRSIGAKDSLRNIEATAEGA